MKRRTLKKLQRRAKIAVIIGASIWAASGILDIVSIHDCGEIKTVKPINTLEAATGPVINNITIASKRIKPEATYMPQKSEDEKESYLKLSERDSYLLAKIAMAEAEGEDTEGKALVIMVILNRVENEDFPGNIEDVIFQKNQFSPVSNGRFYNVEPNKDCYKALKMITEKGWDGSMDALYFESASASTWHRDNLRFLFKHGKHYFYISKE